jgi:plastocyanin
VTNQIAAARRTANRLANTRPPAATISVGASGAGGVERFAMFPANVTVPVGTALTFRMSSGSYDVHTATFGPGDPEKAADRALYVPQLAASFNSPSFAPAATYPSEAPGQPPATLTPTLHGNGFWNTGVMDAVGTTPLPGSNSVRFGQAGSYVFYCLIHPFMKGTVVVQ